MRGRRRLRPGVPSASDSVTGVSRRHVPRAAAARARASSSCDSTRVTRARRRGHLVVWRRQDAGLNLGQRLDRIAIRIEGDGREHGVHELAEPRAAGSIAAVGVHDLDCGCLRRLRLCRVPSRFVEQPRLSRSRATAEQATSVAVKGTGVRRGERSRGPLGRGPHVTPMAWSQPQSSSRAARAISRTPGGPRRAPIPVRPSRSALRVGCPAVARPRGRARADPTRRSRYGAHPTCEIACIAPGTRSARSQDRCPGAARPSPS